MSTDLRANNALAGVLQRYAARLPISEHTPAISLGEGSTPLVRSRHLVARIGCAALYFKLEGCNPTGSFKDRGMVVASAKAAEAGARALLCASTGNTSASAAAYAAHLGLECYVLIPSGYVALGKLAQAIAYGSTVIAIDGNFDAALRLALDLTARHTTIALVNSVNPDRIEGQKTAAFEIVDALGDAPDLLVIPVGNAGNISAYWKGFCEDAERGRASRHPRLLGVQAAGAAPLVNGAPVAFPETVASAIRIGDPASKTLALRARDESGGAFVAVSDQQILAAQQLLARQEGIFGEPASAAPLAALLQAVEQGEDFSGTTIVCIVTGNGLKDPDTALLIEPRRYDLPADAAVIEQALGWS